MTTENQALTFYIYGFGFVSVTVLARATFIGEIATDLIHTPQHLGRREMRHTCSDPSR